MAMHAERPVPRAPRTAVRTERLWSVETALAVRVLDIGLGGALLACSQPFDPGSSFSLRLVLRDRACSVRGTVVRLDRRGSNAAPEESWLVGVSFVEWDRNDRDHLQAFISRSEPR